MLARGQNRPVGDTHRHFQVVPADRPAPEVVGGIGIEESPLLPVVPDPGVQAPPTAAALHHAGEHGLGLDPGGRSAPELALVRPRVGRPGGLRPLVRRLSKRIRNDLQFRSGNPNPLMLRPRPLRLDPPGVPLLGLVPQDVASVDWPVENLPDGGMRPAQKNRSHPRREVEKGQLVSVEIIEGTPHHLKGILTASS